MKTRFAALLLTGLVVTGGGCAGAGVELPSEDTVVIFHNGTGPMCIEALDWLAAMQSEHPGLVVEQRLTTDLNSLLLLEQMKTQYGQSQGVSTTFGYLPLIFFRGHAFSGFNDEVKNILAGLIESMNAPASQGKKGKLL